MAPKADKMKAFYENSLQHLQDELKRIDLLITWQILRLREERHDSTSEEYRGLFISEEEIDNILEKNANPAESSDSSTSQKPKIERFNNHLQELQNSISKKIAVSLERGVYLSLFYLSYLFRLTPIEMDCLLICLAPELDLKYERLYAYLQNDVTKKKPTADLILKLLCHSLEEKTRVRPFFSTQASLFRYNLIRFSDESQERHTPLLSRAIKLDDRIVNFLLGFQAVDARFR